MIVRDQAGGEHACPQVAEVATGKPPVPRSAAASKARMGSSSRGRPTSSVRSC